MSSLLFVTNRLISKTSLDILHLMIPKLTSLNTSNPDNSGLKIKYLNYLQFWNIRITQFYSNYNVIIHYNYYFFNYLHYFSHKITVLHHLHFQSSQTEENCSWDRAEVYQQRELLRWHCQLLHMVFLLTPVQSLFTYRKTN